MAWLEVISIRLSYQEDVENLLSILRQVAETLPVSAEYHCYKNANIDSDWMFALRHTDETMEPGRSRLGLMIIEALRPFGLVNHTAWISDTTICTGK